MKGRSLYNRRSLRLPHFDYSQSGGYFVTLCAFARQSRLGQIQNCEVRLTTEGEIATRLIETLPERFPNVTVDTFIVMPNHVHLLLIIHEQNDPIKGETRPSLGQIVGFLKYQITKQINSSSNTPGRKIWQRNYYEHVIRNEIDYLSIWEYIQNNPLTWETDEEYRTQ